MAASEPCRTEREHRDTFREGGQSTTGTFHTVVYALLLCYTTVLRWLQIMLLVLET